MHSQQTSSKLIFISFSVGVAIYLIYIYTINFQQPEILIQKSIILALESTASCGHFPLLTDLNVTDTYWQVTNTTNGTFYLFNAYYDDRADLPLIQILALVNVIDPIVVTYCQLWYAGEKQPVIKKVVSYKLIWPKYWGVNTGGASPYLITCMNPQPSAVPEYVSIVESNCSRANNILQIRNKKPQNGRKEKFLVSVKELDFETDVSMLLIEWCEILKIFGVSKVEIFVVNAHQNVIRVLKFYESENFVKIKFLKYPKELPNKLSQSWIQWTQNDLIPYHDSFYENMQLYEYMIPMDIDEFIVPLKTEDWTWTDLLMRTISKSKVKNETFDAYPVSNMYFLLKSSHENETIPGIPKNLRFLSNIYRSANFTPAGGNAKTFMRMDRILTVHNHFPFSCLNGESCKLFDVQQVDGQLSHYRIDCDNPECKESKDKPTKDTTLWKYKDHILKAVNATIEKLKDFKSDV